MWLDLTCAENVLKAKFLGQKWIISLLTSVLVRSFVFWVWMMNDFVLILLDSQLLDLHNNEKKIFFIVFHQSWKVLIIKYLQMKNCFDIFSLSESKIESIFSNVSIFRSLSLSLSLAPLSCQSVVSCDIQNNGLKRTVMKTFFA